MNFETSIVFVILNLNKKKLHVRCVETVEILINECQRCASIFNAVNVKNQKREGISYLLKHKIVMQKNENKTNISRLMFQS